MIEITVYLANGHESNYEEIVITKEELMQLACNKAKGMYPENYFNVIRADGDITVKVNAT